MRRSPAAEGWGTDVTHPYTSEGLKERALNLCEDIAEPRRIVSACLYGPWACGYADEKSDLNLLLVLHEHRPRLKAYLKPLDGIDAPVLASDQEAFERDVEQGWLGEFVAEKIATPYEPLVNGEYLWRQEVRLKRRIVWEILENLVWEFPELSRELLIEKDYFLYELIARKARLFSPLTYSFLNMLREDLRDKNVGVMIKGYLKALNQLAEEGWIALSNDHVKVTQDFLEAVKRRGLPTPGLLRSVKRIAFRNVLGIFPTMTRPFLCDQEIFKRLHPGFKPEELVFQLEDPTKHVFVPTPLGLVALSDKVTIEDFVRRTVPGGEVLDVRIEELGGILNTVYLLSLRGDHAEERVVVKRFKDWSGFKWFPLTLWTLGTRGFAVLGRSRLEREYAMNRLLHSHSLPVPEILYVSLRERLIFEEFVEGENLVRAVKRALSTKEAALQEAPLIEKVGETVAKAHGLGVTLGDCKPENIIASGGRTYFVDLEQASREGDQAWDIAEFLYYSGHYASPAPLVSSIEAAGALARDFIKGYLKAGGRKETVREAGSVRYTKVFSVFTPPHIILAISNLCRKLGRKNAPASL